MNLFIGLAVAILFIACCVVFAGMLLIWFGIMAEKAQNTADQRKQMRLQGAERAQEPQNILLRAGTITGAQPETLVRPATADEKDAPETLLRPADLREQK